MSKERISIQELVDLMVENRSITKKSADEFIRVLLSTIEDALTNGELVKVKGLGTFKSQWNEPRRSVDVNTGEEILIEGYYRAVFIPEPALKEAINEPFAHLEPVELGGQEEKIEATIKTEIDEEAELPRVLDVEEPLRVFEEQAEEIKELLSEINSLSTKKPKETTLVEEEISEEIVTEEAEEVQTEEVVIEVSEELIQDEPMLEEDSVENKDEKIEPTEVQVKEINYVVHDDDFNTVRDLSLLLVTDEEPKLDEKEVILEEVKDEAEFEENEEIDIDDELEEELEDEIEEDDDEVEEEVTEMDEIENQVIDSKLDEIEEEEKEIETTDDISEVSESDVKEETIEEYIKKDIEEAAKPQFEAIKDEKENKKSKLPKILLYLLILIALAAIVWFVINLRRYSEMKSSQKRLESIADSTVNALKVKQISDSLDRVNSAFVVDSVQPGNDTIKVVKIEEEKKVDTVPVSTGNVFNARRSYNKFIATEKMTAGSQLTKFARDYYGNPVFWVYIYEANKSKIADPNNVPAGIDINIPKLDSRLIDVKNKECMEYAKKLQTEYLSQ